jgi:hypothetical protein
MVVYVILPECLKTRNIFVPERAGAPFRKFFLRRTQAGTAFLNIFFFLASM